MKKSLTATLAASALVLSFGLASAQAEETVSGPENSDFWFVELSGNPTADGNSLKNVQSEKAAFRAAAKAAGVKFKEQYSYDVLFNGFAVEADVLNRAKLSRLPGVKALWPVIEIQAPEFDPSGGSAPDLANAIKMTGADVAQTALNITGKGVKVAIMDTGIDYHHPDLGGCFGPGCRVEFGHDFVGDLFGTSGDPVPDPDPDDCGGHGTHVAGIVGANGAVKGVAPEVTFGAYRVFGCSGSTNAAIMIAAMERALADGMQVLNMSIGAARQNWPQYPTGAASTRMVNKGMVVVASIGNSGPGGSSPDGLYAAGAPGVGQKVIGVASFDNTHLSQKAFAVSPDNLAVGFNNASGSPLQPASGSLTLRKTGTTTTANDGCNALPAGDWSGKAVLIRRGTCTFHIKALNAQNAGAAAVVLYNNAAGALNPSVVGTPAITIPVVGISMADGAIIDGRIAGGATTLTWGSETIVTPIANGGLISGFSSFGLAADLSIKPDIGAPGGSIWSTIPIEQGRYGNSSGTSMSSPHVAGGVALMLQAKPKTSSNSMRSRLQNSADPAPWAGNPGLGFLDNVHRQGAGMLDIDDAILADVHVEPGKISLGESQFGPQTVTVSVKNDGSSGITFDLSHAPALATGPKGNPFTNVSYFSAPSTISFSTPSVFVPAGGSAAFDVTISPNAGLADHSIYGGYIVLNPQGGGRTYRVPFAGVKGDYQTVPVLFTSGHTFPWLARRTGATSYANRSSGETYTMADAFNIPYFAIHLDHQSRRVRLEAFDAVSGKAFGRVSDDEYVSRNSSAIGFFAFAWDGWTFRGKGKNDNQWQTVPNGQYVVKLSVLKALGDDNNPAHWETWTSPVITIARP